MRLPERKAVTFIVGLRCKDGVVLCSDSLESDGYIKGNVQKLFKYELPGKWGLAFGCSGTSAACSNFGDRLLERIADKVSYDRRSTERLIETTIAEMKQYYPNEFLDVIVGLWSLSPPENRLYKARTNTECLSIEANFVCAGMDVSLARFLLNSIFTDDVTVHDGGYIAAFVTNVMKEKADSVGGPTQLLCYVAGKEKWAAPKKEVIAKIERGGFIEGQFRLVDLEKLIRQFCWSRFPHEYRPAKD